MVSSKCARFGDGKLERFAEWFTSQPRTMFPKDFLWQNKNKEGFFTWYYIYEEGMSIPEDCDVIDFEGGLYAVASDIDGQDNREVIKAIKHFIKEKGCFEEDGSRAYLGNIPTPPSAFKAMGYNQMDYYVPIKTI